MSKIAFTTLLKKSDSSLSPHFGKTKWLMFLDTCSGHETSVRNTGLSARFVIETLVSERCEDVVFSHIGPGALKEIRKRKINGWYGPMDIPVPRLMEMLFSGQLRLARKPRPALADNSKRVVNRRASQSSRSK
jgi:predicted Fe-Mo cluster-binding NifX family protein